MSELKNEEIQTIFTSPPYWNKRTYLESGGLGNEPKPHSVYRKPLKSSKRLF
jgi:DNA modification methylase